MGSDVPHREAQAPPATPARASWGRGERDFSAAILDTIANLIVVLDAEGNIVRFNRGCERASGYAESEVIGKSVFEVLIPDADLPGVRATFSQLRLGQFPNQHENRWRTKDGSERLIEWANTAIVDEQGAVRFVIGTGVDVTDRKRAEEEIRRSEQRLRGLADSMPQLAWTAQPDGYITWYNRRWYEYTGTTPEQMEGWGWQTVHDPAALPGVLARWQQSIATGMDFEMEFPLRGADGRFRLFLTRVHPLKDQDGKVVQWFGTNTDVTDLLVAQAALRDEARRKTEFLAVLSHELRNPLAPIRNSIFLLEKAPPDSPQAARARQVIRRQTEHLTRLVDDLLDVTRISRGKIQLQREVVDLRDLVRRTCEDHRTLFEEAGVDLHLDFPVAPVWSEVDPTRIAQAIGNLLNNAIKFTPRNGAVAVRLRGRGEHAEVSVRDTGAGMAPAQVARMFEPFAQEDRTLARTRGGLGLGLALSKGLIELHGGTMTARSDGPGKGSEFTIALPLAAGTRQVIEVPAGTLTSASRRRVLIIEDNVDAARTLADVLEVVGHEVTVAHDGTTGIALARELKPDVVICDLGLPDVDGYAVARTLRQDEALRSTRLFAVSGYAQAEDKARAEAAGFDGHLPKPAPLAELNALLHSPRRVD